MQADKHRGMPERHGPGQQRLVNTAADAPPSGIQHQGQFVVGAIRLDAAPAGQMTIDPHGANSAARQCVDALLVTQPPADGAAVELGVLDEMPANGWTIEDG